MKTLHTLQIGYVETVSDLKKVLEKISDVPEDAKVTAVYELGYVMLQVEWDEVQ